MVMHDCKINRDSISEPCCFVIMPMMTVGMFLLPSQDNVVLWRERDTKGMACHVERFTTHHQNGCKHVLQQGEFSVVSVGLLLFFSLYYTSKATGIPWPECFHFPQLKNLCRKRGHSHGCNKQMENNYVARVSAGKKLILMRKEK